MTMMKTVRKILGKMIESNEDKAEGDHDTNTW